MPLQSISNLLSIKFKLCGGGWPSGLTGQALINFKDNFQHIKKGIVNGKIHSLTLNSESVHSIQNEAFCDFWKSSTQSDKLPKVISLEVEDYTFENEKNLGVWS